MPEKNENLSEEQLYALLVEEGRDRLKHGIAEDVTECVAQLTEEGLAEPFVGGALASDLERMGYPRVKATGAATEWTGN